MNGAVVIITGTSRGIGRFLASHYLQNGAHVFGCGRSDGTVSHPRYKHYSLDVGDEKAVVSMVRAAARHNGNIDALINNAGIASMNHIATTPTAQVKEIFNTNFIGSFIFCREVAKIMARKGGGAIVNFSTVATPLNLEGEAAYAASKAALESFTRVCAKEFGNAGVRVNAVGPTPIKTDLTKSVPAEKMEALIDRQAIRRWCKFEDVANVTDFLIDEKSTFVTGQVIYLGGIS